MHSMFYDIYFCTIIISMYYISIIFLYKFSYFLLHNQNVDGIVKITKDWSTPLHIEASKNSENVSLRYE